MGTIVEMTACASSDDGAQLQSAIDLAFEEFARLERLCNFFSPESELSRVNREAFRSPVSISAELFEILRQGVEYGRRSHDCFSIALAPLTELWRRCGELGHPPTPDAWRRACEASDWRLIRLDPERQSVRFLHAEAKLDLGGFVKGWAVDQARRVLQEHGVAAGFVNAGQSGLCGFGGSSKDDEGAGWAVGLRHPGDERCVSGAFILRARSAATSGVNERSFEIAGETFSHLIDPHSGRPTTKVASATVICSSAAEAEVAAKMLFFLGCQEGVARCDENGWAIEGATLEGDGEDVRLTHTADFPMVPNSQLTEQ